MNSLWINDQFARKSTGGFSEVPWLSHHPGGIFSTTPPPPSPRCPPKARTGRRRTQTLVWLPLPPPRSSRITYTEPKTPSGRGEDRGERGADKDGGGGRAILSRGLDSGPFIGTRGLGDPGPALPSGASRPTSRPRPRPPAPTQAPHRAAAKTTGTGSQRGCLSLSVKTKTAENRYCFGARGAARGCCLQSAPWVARRGPASSFPRPPSLPHRVVTKPEVQSRQERGL